MLAPQASAQKTELEAHIESVTELEEQLQIESLTEISASMGSHRLGPLSELEILNKGLEASLSFRCIFGAHSPHAPF